MTQLTLSSRYDAVVVGARCAGAATAMLLARAGLSVLAVDRSRYGADTVSTHALMRGAVLQLHRWGLLPALEGAGTPAIRRTVFHYGDEAVDLPITPRDGVDALYAPRRTVLDALLVDAAVAAGAEVVHGVRVADLVRSPGGRVSGVVLRGEDGEQHRVDAGIVIGADGVGSSVARWVDAPVLRAAANAGGTLFGYWPGLGIEATHWYFAPGIGAGAIPTNDGDTCVFVGVPEERWREEVRGRAEEAYPRLLATIAPELAERVAAAPQAPRLRSFAGVRGFLRRSWGPGWALVGDAGYFKDPITAHGITDALIGAELLARAVVTGGDAALAGYQAARDDLGWRFAEITDAVASYAWTLPEVQAMHLEMSAEMKREVDAILELDRAAAPALAVSA